MDQFIKIYENVLSEDLIADLIAWADKPKYEMVLGTTEVYKGQPGELQFEEGRLGRHDYQKFLKFSNSELLDRCNEQITPYLSNYAGEYPGVLGSVSYEIKLQKTPISGGYSAWHAEQGAGNTSTRVLSWLAYLNDVEEGGETEFLYQGVKQKPVKGTLVIWPASFTHTHRGNPPYSNEKYVITGWTNFRYEEE